MSENASTNGSPMHLQSKYKSQKRWICAWRAIFWTSILTPLTRGLSITLPDSNVLVEPTKVNLPTGPLILVANHSSHMDSAVLASILGYKRNILFVAAGDYWSSSQLKSWIGRNLAGLFLVSRGGNGFNELLASTPLLHEGTVLVIYPEGTRSRTGEIARFHSGAFRLAIATGARILPVALIGCRQALPVHGKFTRQKIVVRFANPIEVTEATLAESTMLARDLIVSMLNENGDKT